MNLGHPASADINDMVSFFHCVDSVLPQILVPFSDTPESVENARAYLDGQVMVVDRGFEIEEYSLPVDVIAKAASNRAGLVQCIVTLLSKPEIALRNPSLLALKHDEPLALDEFKARAGSNDTTVASNETFLSERSRGRGAFVVPEFAARSPSLDEIISSSTKQKIQPKKTFRDEFACFSLFSKKSKVLAGPPSEITAVEKTLD